MEIAASLSTNCRHCGTEFCALSERETFCCSGCEYVHGLLQKEGLGDFYRLRDSNPPSCPLPVQPSEESFEYCDDPSFIEKMSREGTSDGLRITFYLEGLNCTACLWLLEKLPTLCPAAASARVNMSSSLIEVARHRGASFAQIARALNRFGYRPHPLQAHDEGAALKRRENRIDMIRIGIAAAAAGNIMILAVSLYGGATGELATQFRWLSGLIALPALTYSAWPFYRSSWGALRSRHLNLDVPIVAAVLAGIVFSIWGLLIDSDTVYFDSLTMLVFLLASSRFWLKRIQQHHLDVSHLEDYLLMGTVNRVSKDGRMESVSSLSLRKGDVIEVGGETVVPADGLVVKGEGLVQTAVLTGEVAPHSIEEGDRVEAGSRNISGQWLMKVDRGASESRLAQILKDAERSAREKPELVRFADKVSHWFIGVVLALAAVVAVTFLFSDPKEGFARALALIIVTCPCVFGMAIPLSMSLAVRASARRGMIIKDSDVFERISAIEEFYFDKTGTLTTGNLRVLKIDVRPGSDEHLRAALVLEKDQPHPVARAIVKAVHERMGEGLLDPRSASAVRLLPEGGITGVVDGRTYTISPTNSSLGNASIASGDQIRARYALNFSGSPVAYFEVGDEIRPEAIEVLHWVASRGGSSTLLSGDRESTVQACAKGLGLPPSRAISSASPERKSALLKEAGVRSLMVGDGANDAAALASASVGVAVRGSMDVSLRAADVYLTRSELTALPALFDVARRTRGAIVRNLCFSASFNLVAGGLALTGHMTPLWAAVLMPLSSLTVLASALATGRELENEADRAVVATPKGNLA